MCPMASPTLQGTQRRLVEDLADEAELFVDDDGATVGDSHPGRLLAAVLQRIETVIGHLADVFLGCPDPENTALFAGTHQVLGSQGGVFGQPRQRRGRQGRVGASEEGGRTNT